MRITILRKIKMNQTFIRENVPSRIRSYSRKTMYKRSFLYLLLINAASGCQSMDECSSKSCMNLEEGHEEDDPSCPPGTRDCPCDMGVCHADLSCVDNLCIEAECIPDYYPCHDNQEGELGSCCQGAECLGYEDGSLWMCAPRCWKHSECVSDCCTSVEGLENFYCSPITSGCQKCIDSCHWSKDGTCDDGGSGSEFSVCELGTDCSDCGDR